MIVLNQEKTFERARAGTHTHTHRQSACIRTPSVGIIACLIGS